MDLIALSSALICAVHCAALPVVLSLTSLSALRFLENPLIEWTFICLGVVFIYTSLWPSYKQIHGNKKPLVYAAFGMGFIALGRLHLTDVWEMSHTVIGTFLVSFAHYFNWKLLRVKVACKH